MFAERRYLPLALACLCMIGIGFTRQNAEISAQAKRRPVLTVNDMMNATVVGRLGVELGHVCTVEGTLIADPSRGKSRKDRILFQVSSVNGKSMSQPITFQDTSVSYKGFDFDRWSQPELIGQRLKLAVYETGAFEGLPQGDIYRERIAGLFFHFQPQLRVVHDFADGPAPRDERVPVPFHPEK